MAGRGKFALPKPQAAPCRRSAGSACGADEVCDASEIKARHSGSTMAIGTFARPVVGQF
jgi:hypothetical protein